jgi:hypothetical protein
LKFVLFLFGLLAIGVGYATYLEWDVTRWDAKIDALCAANGGKDVATRVYETAVAPETKEYFADLKSLKSFGVPERSKGRALGPQYPFVMETRVVNVIRDRDPSVVRYTERIVRVSDNKTLGERFRYQRGGGGMPFFDPGTNHNCPKDSLGTRVDVHVFLNHPFHHLANTK